MKIAIYGKSFKSSFHYSIRELFRILENKKANVTIYKPFYEYIKKELDYSPKISGVFVSHKEVESDTSLVFSIGGDGTFLESVSFVRNKGIPIVGINSGRLGFLANISKEELPIAIKSIFEKKYSIEYRSLIQLETENNLFGDFSYALNELTVLKKDSSSMINIHVYMNDEFLNTYWADGLIIATPTGSTAYSLSAGGPIVIPTSDNFVITPLAPHNLTVRPIVIPNNNSIRLHIEGRDKKFLASLDYRYKAFESSTILEIKKADFKIKMLNLPNHSYFSTIRNKLMWGADKRN